MQIEQTPGQEIVITRRKGINRFAPLLFALIVIVGLEAFFIIIFIQPNQNMFSKFFSLSLMLLFLLEPSIILFVCRRALKVIWSNTPTLQINQQGIILLDPYRFAFQSRSIPWSEIAKISCYHSQNLLLTITLKNPSQWWLSYGNGKPRKFPRNLNWGNAQFAFSQNAISISLLELLQQIKMNYAHEIQMNEVEIVPFASPFITN